MAAAKLYIVGTPIGHLGDTPPRAIEALAKADAIFCEDTRVTGKLCAALGIDGAQAKLRRLDDNMLARGGERDALALLAQGRSVAYCSDAGMPGISDPGQRLVAAVQESDIDATIELVPGPSACTCALVASGIDSSAYYFGGFLPRKAGDITRALDELRTLDAALIFYESPKRVTSSLQLIADSFPTREVAVCRELTKLHEEVLRAPALEAVKEFAARSEIKGEIAIVIAPPTEEELAQTKSESHQSAIKLASILANEKTLSKREITEALQDICGISRNDAYEIALNSTEASKTEALSIAVLPKTEAPSTASLPKTEVPSTAALSATQTLSIAVLPKTEALSKPRPLVDFASLNYATEEQKAEWRAIVEAFVPALIERWEPIIGVKSGKLAFRNMKSRWGSCQPATGRICINTRLALYPPECLEYVVVHELCHLRERGHGPAFKALLDQYLPNWRQTRKLLR